MKVAGTKEDEKEEWEGRKGVARRKRRRGQEKEKGEEETEEEDNDDYDGEEKEFLAYKYIVNVLLQNMFDKARWVRPLVECSTVFSCDSSSISRNVGRSVCLSVCQQRVL